MTVPPLVDLTRDIEASPETVWGILTTPELFSGWMDGQVTFEPTVGSAFRAEFPNFQTVIAGTIVRLDTEARTIEMTWGVESGPQADHFPAGSSLVSMSVEAVERGCRVHLTHAQLPSTAEAMDHEGGWRFHLSKMALVANRTDLAAGLDRTLADWFAAWNDQDDASRLETLRRCCSADVEFRDDWTEMSGVDLLNQHIANCFRYMPGYALEPDGDVRICRGEALVAWRTHGPMGEQVGINHICASPDGTILRVTGFAKP
ncbi:MAG: SRPBCC domain-containing protein [Gemmatimonadota bacterium]